MHNENIEPSNTAAQNSDEEMLQENVESNEYEEPASDTNHDENNALETKPEETMVEEENSDISTLTEDTNNLEDQTPYPEEEISDNNDDGAIVPRVLRDDDGGEKIKFKR